MAKAKRNFEGLLPNECGEHRTVGTHRAWCYVDSEWCYPELLCRGCEIGTLRHRIAELEAELKKDEESYETLVQEAEAMEAYIPKLQEEKRQLEAELAKCRQDNALTWHTMAKRLEAENQRLREALKKLQARLQVARTLRLSTTPEGQQMLADLLQIAQEGDK